MPFRVVPSKKKTEAHLLTIAVGLGTAGQDLGAMMYSQVPPAYPYFKASPCPYPAYPPFEAFGIFATEPAGAAAGAFDPQFSMQPFG